MIINALAQLTSCLTNVLPASASPAFSPSDSETAASLEQNHSAFRQLTETRVSEAWPMGARLWCGMPFLAGMSVEEFIGLVAVAGIVTLVGQGLYKFWESRNKPFGDLEALNRIVHEWAVMSEGDARVHARRLGEAFLKTVRTARERYDNQYFQVPYTIDPRKWGRMDERRQRLTGDYVRKITVTFQQFAQGLQRISQDGFKDVYEDVFGSFMHNVFLAIGPVTRWQDPPTQEDIANFDHFQKVLRREISALEMKMEALSEPQAV